jgi:hypothetical protein
MNSRLLDFYLKQISTTFHGGYVAANKQFIERIPIRIIDAADPEAQAKHDRVVSLVERMLEMHSQTQGVRTPQTKRVLRRRIDEIDRQIDGIVYELYGLTPEEIKIVEEGMKSKG